MYNTMFTELSDKNIVNGVILGVKTGYTNEAGLCFATLAKVYSQEYILITYNRNKRKSLFRTI